MDLNKKIDKLSLDNHKEHINTRILEKFADRIKTDELSLTRGKTNKDKANRATVENVLDPRTMRFLKALINRGIISEFNGCLSTGKEANVYHAFAGDNDGLRVQGKVETAENAVSAATTEQNPAEKKEYAVKIYKTSILVFKDRERYVDGEFRFRNSRSQHNPRKMIKIWAEKEFRNLRRIYQTNVIPCPKPVEIKSNVLIMEFLNRGDGFASPRLKDYSFKDREEIIHYYHLMVAYIRLLYQICRLVHADLSEYNSIVHDNKLYIIDVSQSVQPEHPMSLDFLRMDIKNINNYFEKLGIEIFSERVIFQFVISEQLDKFNGDYKSAIDLEKYVSKNLSLKLTEEDEAEDEIFRSLHLVRNLGGLEERDFDRFTDGKFDLLKSLIVNENMKNAKNFNAMKQYEVVSSEDEDFSDGNELEEDDEDNNNDGTDCEEDICFDEDEEWFSSDSEQSKPKGKKYEDKDEKKVRKQQAKEAKRERRKTKVKKHVKKKLIKKSNSKK